MLLSILADQANYIEILATCNQLTVWVQLDDLAFRPCRSCMIRMQPGMGCCSPL